MKEDLLHYVWKTKNFQVLNCSTTKGLSIEIIHFGQHNFNAGPDFLEAQILIDGVLWCGHVEMHLKASDWYHHKHQNDPNYENVILHVVLEDDQVVYRQDNTEIPCLVILPLIRPGIMNGYSYLLSNTQDIPCAHVLKDSDKTRFLLNLNKIYTERLEKKSNRIFIDLIEHKVHWEQVLFKAIARGFGLPVNAFGMEQLANILPVQLLYKHQNSLLDLDALILGTAGLLPKKSECSYIQELIRNYTFFESKYRIQTMDTSIWKFARMRPLSFPTIMLAHLAQLYYKHPNLHSVLLQHSIDIHEIRHIFGQELPSFWDRHYVLTKSSKKRSKKLGKNNIDKIINNALIPFYFSYGKYNGDDRWTDLAFRLAEQLAPEQNKIIRKWNAIQVKPENALESQALIELYQQYCIPKRCTSCAFGYETLKKMSSKIQESACAYSIL